jgi:hypothetical protein
MRDLEYVLPEEIKKRALRSGNELILSHEDGLTAIAIATEHNIAVLGFELGEVLDNGFQVLDYSGTNSSFFRIGMPSLARTIVRRNAGIKEHRLSNNHGCIITSTSEREFAKLQLRDKE